MTAHAQRTHRLVYLSRQAPAVCADLDLMVGQIIETAIRRNGEDQLTGLLVCFQGLFIQALEGRSDRVMTTYGRILRDSRHIEPRVLSASPAEGRLFGEWTMCARTLAAADKAIIDVLDARGPVDPARLTGASALRLLTTVADIQRRATLAA
ncbi:MAG: BLUF domain-containing protein [Caulobacteraceae bacterium]